MKKRAAARVRAYLPRRDPPDARPEAAVRGNYARAAADSRGDADDADDAAGADSAGDVDAGAARLLVCIGRQRRGHGGGCARG